MVGLLNCQLHCSPRVTWAEELKRLALATSRSTTCCKLGEGDNGVHQGMPKQTYEAVDVSVIHHRPVLHGLQPWTILSFVLAT